VVIWGKIMTGSIIVKKNLAFVIGLLMRTYFFFNLN